MNNREPGLAPPGIPDAGGGGYIGPGGLRRSAMQSMRAVAASRRISRWGATSEEVDRSLPGDGEVRTRRLPRPGPSPSMPRLAPSGRGWPRWAGGGPGGTATT